MKGLIIFVGSFLLARNVNSLELMRVSSKMMNGQSTGMFGGKISTLQKHPYLAILKKNRRYSCAGTILTKDFVITTADCVYGSVPANLSVMVGSPDGTVGAQYRINNITIHPEFDITDVYFNVALVQIEGQFTWCDTVKAAKLPKKPVADNSKLKVAGYSPYFQKTTDVCTSSMEKILEGQLKWYPEKFCASHFSDLNFTGSIACAYNKGKTSLCAGDWGDVLVKNNIVYGLFIGFNAPWSCSVDAGPGIFTDIYVITNWINNIISNNLYLTRLVSI